MSRENATCPPSAREQQSILWQKLLDHLHEQHDTSLADSPSSTTCRNSRNDRNATSSWPSYDQVLADLASADYTDTLQCPLDYRPGRPVPSLCPLGVVGCVDLEIFPNSANPYTGLLGCSNDVVIPGILRMSSALPPPQVAVSTRIGKALLYAIGGTKLRTAQLFPCVALKLFRGNGADSANLLLAGSKVGQRERNFFAHPVCTSMTEQMPRAMRPLVQKFWEYSDYPLSLGVSNVCTTTTETKNANSATTEKSDETDSVVFPFAVILHPRVTNYSNSGEDAGESVNNNNNNDDAIHDFLRNTTQQITPDTILYDVFCCPAPHDVPHADRLQRIGIVRATSEFVKCPSGTLFFRHQQKEEDYTLRPEWKEALKERVTIDNGQTVGTIGMLAGWKLFEQQIARGVYQDFSTNCSD